MRVTGTPRPSVLDTVMPVAEVHQGTNPIAKYVARHDRCRTKRFEIGNGVVTKVCNAWFWFTLLLLAFSFRFPPLIVDAH